MFQFLFNLQRDVVRIASLFSPLSVTDARLVNGRRIGRAGAEDHHPSGDVQHQEDPGCRIRIQWNRSSRRSRVERNESKCLKSSRAELKNNISLACGIFFLRREELLCTTNFLLFFSALFFFILLTYEGDHR